jgi:hypothetical protein
MAKIKTTIDSIRIPTQATLLPKEKVVSICASMTESGAVISIAQGVLVLPILNDEIVK